MSLRLLFSFMIALATLLAPIGIKSGSAMAMAPDAAHHSEMMESGHCGEQQPTEDNGSDQQSCCAAMCTAIAVAAEEPIEPHILTSSARRPSLDRWGRSFLADLPTPPPRLA